MLKVAVDARPLARPLTGIGRYTLGICNALLRAGEISLYLYSPNKIANVLEGQSGRQFKRNLGLRSGVLVQIWAETFLPHWAKLDDIDVYWGPAHRLPHRLLDRIATVLTIHDLCWRRFPKTMRVTTRWLDRIHMPMAVRRARCITTVSEFSRREIQREFPDIDSDICVVYPGRPEAIRICGGTEDILQLEDLGIEKSYFLFVGTLEPRKNLQRLLEAYVKLPYRLKQAVLMVLAGGKGWGQEDVGRIVRQFGIERQVRVLGYVTDRVLEVLYRNALFLAMPSLYEGFGLPVLEAMTYGTPVLTSNDGALSEVAGRAGMFVDPRDVNAIASGLERMIDDEGLRGALSRAAVEEVKRYSWDRAAGLMTKIFYRTSEMR